MAFGYSQKIEQSYFIIYNQKGSEELSKVDNILYLNLLRQPKKRVYHVENDINKERVTYSFLELEQQKKTIGVDSFPINNIHFFEDTLISITENRSVGLVSFGITKNKSEEFKNKHREVRDSIVNVLVDESL